MLIRFYLSCDFKDFFQGVADSVFFHMGSATVKFIFPFETNKKKLFFAKIVSGKCQVSQSTPFQRPCSYIILPTAIL